MKTYKIVPLDVLVAGSIILFIISFFFFVLSFSIKGMVFFLSFSILTAIFSVICGEIKETKK